MGNNLLGVGRDGEGAANQGQMEWRRGEGSRLGKIIKTNPLKAPVPVDPRGL